jgi:NAD(P)-dependent dehydrogenase (short-subunit alcohol dehydrogenase family)
VQSDVSTRSGPLEDQRALVVGGGSGIGYASARRLARDGALVTIAGRTESTLRAAQERLAADGITVAWTTCDVLDSAQVRAAVDAASDDEGRLEIAVVVPGAPAIGPVLLIDDDRFSRLVDGNVRPVFLLLKYAGRAMVRSGRGSFVAISSTAAEFAARYFSPYSAGKAAVDHLVRVAASELGPLGIRVNSVRPGLTRTGATEGLMADAEYVAAFVDLQAIKRPGEADDIGQAVRFFAGPESSWVTGQVLTVDGGHTLREFVDYSAFMDLPDVRSVVLEESRDAG